MKLVSVTVLALLSLSPPQSRDAEIETLKRELAALKAQQAQMQRDLQAIKSLLQGALQAQNGPEVPDLVGRTLPLSGEPTMGNAGAKVTVVEVSDYHCPFCRRHVLQTFPRILKDYVETGRVQYAFVDYPIASLHPDAFRAHEAAACAQDQGKFWEMHFALFGAEPARDPKALVAKAAAAGVDRAKFEACLTSGTHANAVRESAARMEQLGISGTPMTLIGLTPAPGQPMQIVQYVYGAHPYEKFKETIEAVLKDAR